MSANDEFQQSISNYLGSAQSVAQQGLANMESITEGRENVMAQGVAAMGQIGSQGVTGAVQANTQKFLKEMGVDMSTKGAVEGAGKLLSFTGGKIREQARLMDSTDSATGQKVGLQEYRGPNDSSPMGVRPAEAPPVTAQKIGGETEAPPVTAEPIPPSYETVTASGSDRVEVEKPRLDDATPDEESLSSGRAVGQVASGEGGTDLISQTSELSRRVRGGETFDPQETMDAIREGRLPKSNEQMAQEASQEPSTLFKPTETDLGGGRAEDSSVDRLDEGGEEFSAPRSLNETYGGSIRPQSELPEPARPMASEIPEPARPAPAVSAESLNPQPQPQVAPEPPAVKAPVEPTSVEPPPPAYDDVKPQGEFNELKSDLGTETKQLTDTVTAETGEITASLGSTIAEAAGTGLKAIGGMLGDVMPFLGPIMAGVGLYEGLHDMNKAYQDAGNDPYAKVRQQVNLGQNKIDALSTTISADQFASKIGGSAPAFGSLAAPTFSTAQQAGGMTGHF